MALVFAVVSATVCLMGMKKKSLFFPCRSFFKLNRVRLLSTITAEYEGQPKFDKSLLSLYLGWVNLTWLHKKRKNRPAIFL